jgi:hypothetical protein
MNTQYTVKGKVWKQCVGLTQLHDIRKTKQTMKQRCITDVHHSTYPQHVSSLVRVKYVIEHGKFTLEQDMKALRGIRGIALLCL